ncbi:uncharacterized protein LOC113563438 [Ooceraea biroi]|uniref:uncharacterized protein LOC113563438 n=1 Tax=Ooceraea biroi TaxID=2015173 RepID=UPI000F08ABB5|nr:uncharacterized protein LOC113563438 [Ooceraea biroi]
MAGQVLQANLNRARRAQDLFLQSLAERGYALGIAAEPFRPPADGPSWAVGGGGLVAIVRGDAAGSPPLRVLEVGGEFVAAQWGGITVVGVYVSPSLSLAEYEGFLDRLGGCIVRHPRGLLLVAGDFNAKSALWGSRRPDAKGAVLADWAAGLGLHLLNVGSDSTCVRWAGESVVDLTWASPALARRVSGWRVLSGVETLSDHRYVSMVVSPPSGSAPRQRGTGGPRPRRWALKGLSGDRLVAALLASTWPERPEGTVEEEAGWLGDIVTQACDFAMPRAGRPRRRPTYWWSAGLAELRRASGRAWRRFSRARRRGTAAEVDARYGELQERRSSLRAAIRDAKARAWEELLRSVEGDPWGRPYRLVMGKLRQWTPPETEEMDPLELRGVLDTLFPAGGGCPGPRSG